MNQSGNLKTKVTHFLQKFLAHIGLSVFVILIAAETLYVSTTYFYLNSESFSELIQPQPAEFKIQFSKAWSWLPGRVSFNHLKIEKKSISGEWKLETNSGSLWLNPFELRKNILKVYSASTEHSSFSWLSSKVIPPPTDNNPSSWTFELQNLNFVSVDSVLIDENEFKNIPSVETGFKIERSELTTVYNAKIEYNKSEWLVDSKPVLSLAEGHAFLYPRDFKPESTRTRKVSPFLWLKHIFDFDLDFKAQVNNLEFLNFYFKQTPWVHIYRGTGELAVEGKLQNELLNSQSSANIKIKDANISILNHEISGDGDVHLQIENNDVSKNRSALTINLNDFQIKEEKAATHPLIVSGKNLLLKASSEIPTGMNEIPKDIKIQIIIPKTEVKDLSAFNIYIPSSLGFKLLSGKGFIEAQIPLGLKDADENGFLRLAVSKSSAKFESLQLDGDISMNLKLNSADIEKRIFDVSGSQLNFDNIEIHDDRALKIPDWRAKLQLSNSKLNFGIPISANTHIQLDLKDSLPFLALYESKQKKPLSSWVKNSLQFKNVHIDADLNSSQDSTTVNNLVFTSEKSKLMGHYQRSGKNFLGIFLTQFGIFNLGIEMRNDEKTFKIIGAKSWYKKHEKDHL